jgi:tRNA pseudouridine55 synthase
VTRRGNRVDGVLLLDKPAGISSNAALQRARRALGAQKGGHTGTLDPLASGLLPVCLGEATKFSQFLLDADKGYVATVRFGTRTDTLDAEGAVLSREDVALTRADVEAGLARFVGRQRQRPPAHAAIKQQGRPLYAYARAGQDVPRQLRDIEIRSLALRSWQPPDAVIEVACSKGTYVRVLAADLGDALGCGAHLAALRRTSTGGFSLADAIPLDRLEAMPPAQRLALLRPADALVAHLPRLEVDAGAGLAFVHGQPIAVPGPGANADAAGAGDANRVLAVFCEGRLLGVAAHDDGLARPRRVVAADPGASMQPG